MVRQYLTQIDADQRMVDELTAIEVKIEPIRPARDAVVTIPGVSTVVALIIIAETGADMAVFPTSAHLASRAGVCPGQNEFGSSGSSDIWWGLWGESVGGEEHAGSVVVAVAVAAGGAAVELDDPVCGLGATVR